MRFRPASSCFALVAAALVTAACGQSQEEKQAEEVKQAAEQVGQSANDMAKGFEEMAKGLGAMAGNNPDMKPVEPVGFRDLQAVFGDLAGWEKGKPTGEKMTMPVNFSRAEVNYTKDDSRIKVQISDSGFNQMLMIPYSMFLTAGYEKETADGYEKSTKVGDHPGWEKWDSDSKHGELNAIVSKRFIVQAEGSQIDDIKALHTAMASVDLNKLAAMK
jgi:hypothetical protein